MSWTNLAQQKDLRLGYKLIHAYNYDCALFWKEFENRKKYMECDTIRYKTDVDKGKRILHKMLCYLLLKLRVLCFSLIL